MGNIWNQRTSNVRDNLTPETRLWRCVLAQVLDDAFSTTYEVRNSYEKEHARQFLRRKNHDFAMICQYAGFDPDYVHRKVKKKFVDEFLERIKVIKGGKYEQTFKQKPKRDS